MPLIIACPQCHGKLRVADELRGQRLRCPACDHTFENDEAASPPPLNPDPAPLDPRDLPLRLTLDETDSTSSNNDQRGLVGAVEVMRPNEDVSPAPAVEPPAPKSPPILNDEHEDLKQCPQCGVHIHRDATRCTHCGERLMGGRRYGEEREIRRRPRRDAEPDRGVLVLVLGILSLACITILCFAPIGAILGLIAWVMGQIDLRKMQRGTMDDNGQSITRAGWICGLIGTILNGLATLACLGFIGFAWYMDVSRPPNTRPMIVTSPTPQPMGPAQPKKQLRK